MNEPTNASDKDLDISGNLGGGNVIDFLDLIPGLGDNDPPVDPVLVDPSGGNDDDPNDPPVDPAADPNDPPADPPADPPVDDPNDPPADPADPPVVPDADDLPADSDYKSIVKTMVANGTWLPVEGIDEMEVDKDTFQQIVEEQGKANTNTLLEGKVSIDTLPDVLKQAIEIAQSGGNPLEVLQANAEMQNPFDGLDLDVEQNQVDLLAWRYRKNGLADKDIEPILNNLKQKGELKGAANVVKEEVDTQYQNYVAKLKQDAIDLKAEEAVALKEYKKIFKENLTQFELNDSFTRKLVDSVTKKEEDGSLGLDAIYNDIRKDPVKAAELALYLLNKEEYVAQLSNKKINQAKAETFKTIKLAPKSKAGSTQAGDPEKNKSGKREVISFAKLNEE